jgi:hypothetical protein
MLFVDAAKAVIGSKESTIMVTTRIANNLRDLILNVISSFLMLVFFFKPQQQKLLYYLLIPDIPP